MQSHQIVNQAIMNEQPLKPVANYSYSAAGLMIALDKPMPNIQDQSVGGMSTNSIRITQQMHLQSSIINDKSTDEMVPPPAPKLRPIR